MTVPILAEDIGRGRPVAVSILLINKAMSGRPAGIAGLRLPDLPPTMCLPTPYTWFQIWHQRLMLKFASRKEFNPTIYSHLLVCRGGACRYCPVTACLPIARSRGDDCERVAQGKTQLSHTTCIFFPLHRGTYALFELGRDIYCYSGGMTLG